MEYWPVFYDLEKMIRRARVYRYELLQVPSESPSAFKALMTRVNIDVFIRECHAFQMDILRPWERIAREAVRDRSRD